MPKFLKLIFFLFLIISVDINSQGNNIQNISIKDGLPNTSINNIIQDKIGYLWLATDKGLFQFDGDHFKHINLHSQSKALSLFEKNKTLFVGHEKGFFKIKAGKFSYLGKNTVLKTVFVKNKILLCTTQGVYEFKETYLQPLKIHPQIDFSIIKDIIQHKNSIYIATNNGLWIVDKLNKTKKVIKITDEQFSSFLLNKENLITCTLNNELKIIDGNKIINSFKTIENISSIKKIKDEIWVTSNGYGIEVLDEKNYSFKRKINKYNSTISNNINNVFIDNQNTIWIASRDKGLYKLTSIKNNKTPNIAIESISVNYKRIQHFSDKVLELKPTENNVSFSFNTIDLKNAKNIKFRYKLNKDFTPWSSQNKVDFANLKAGKYTLTIQSKNLNKVSKPISFKFNIDFPIYKKDWFLLICLIVFCLILAGVVDIYIRKLKKKNNQKIEALKLENHLQTLEQKALQLQMNPHFIFNVLNGIKALGNSGNSKELNKTISLFSILLRSVLNNSRLNEISLQDEILTLETYLQLEQKMSSKDFNFTLETSLNNIDSEEILIPPMLVQPFVENCIKHAFNSNNKNATIKVLFYVKNSFLYFNIEDNGVGFYQSKKEKNTSNHQSIALKLTQERIKHLTKYNSFSINELKEKNTVLGTRISFKIPLKTDY
ncbi:MAG: histidine kinase [Polaribacter sp.]|uniref:sensor histidine kinase n=1 Tax=Polaribacter sp. TaxID=1920175 RepID=UPI00326479AA